MIAPARFFAALFSPLYMVMFLAALWHTSAMADVKRVTVTGSADATMPEALDRAVEDALRKAVEQVAGLVLTSRSEALNFALNYDKIVSRASGVVKEYKIQRTYREGDILHAVVEATVSDKKVADLWGEIKILRDRVNNPRFLVVVRDRVAGKPPSWPQWPQGVGQTAVEKVFIEKGFPTVDRQLLESLSPDERQVLAESSDPQRLAAVANRLRVELLILGTAEATKGERYVIYDIPHYFSRGECVVKAITPGTGRIVGTHRTESHRGAQNEEEATKESIRFAAAEAAEKLCEQIVRHFINVVGGEGVESILIVENCASYQESQRLLGLLKEQPGVREVRLRHYEKPIATYELILRPKYDIAQVMLSLPGVRFEIESASTGTLKGRLKE